MKYRVSYKVTCKCYIEVEADCIEDAMEIADEEALDLDNVREIINNTGVNFSVEAADAEQIRPLLMEVYGVDEFRNVLYKED